MASISITPPQANGARQSLTRISLKRKANRWDWTSQTFNEQIQSAMPWDQPTNVALLPLLKRLDKNKSNQNENRSTATALQSPPLTGGLRVRSRADARKHDARPKGRREITHTLDHIIRHQMKVKMAIDLAQIDPPAADAAPSITSRSTGSAQ